jgi:hypothetical protein
MKPPFAILVLRSAPVSFAGLPKGYPRPRMNNFG